MPETLPADELTRLVYELLDAHHDTARIAADLWYEPVWSSHLEYLRALQRVAREVMARTTSESLT